MTSVNTASPTNNMAHKPRQIKSRCDICPDLGCASVRSLRVKLVRVSHTLLIRDPNDIQVL
jgi:hypothetical protein